ncbi:MAG: hypothetical protein KJO64_05830, partial [Bacteroidia bacterium]|nr:hypothetical protein [Bacteroidia bacterium]
MRIEKGIKTPKSSSVFEDEGDMVNVRSQCGPIDSTSLFKYTPASLLKPGQLEAKLFNNLYTQTSFYNRERIETKDS